MALVKTVDDLRAATVQRLKSLPVIPQKVAVIPEDAQDITTEINKALGMAGGLVIIVYTGNATNINQAAPIPSGQMDLIVEVAEIPAVNRGSTGTKIPAEELSRICIRALHQFDWAVGRSLTFTEREYRPEQSLVSNKKLKVVQYFVTFQTIVSLDAEIGVN